jgi:hypothetical protein
VADRQQCAARSKQTGQQCKHLAIPGGTVCRVHGGSAPQVQAVALRRLQADQARADLRRLGVAIETTPIEALEAMLYEAAGNVTVLRAMVAELDQDGDNSSSRSAIYGPTFHESGSPTGKGEPHVLVVMYNQERDRLAKLAEACAKLGLDERRVKLAEAQVARLFEAVKRAAHILPSEHAAGFTQALAAELRSGA